MFLIYVCWFNSPVNYSLEWILLNINTKKIRDTPETYKW